MNKKYAALIPCVCLAAVMLTGCKTGSQSATSYTPQVISPEVTINQDDGGKASVISVSGSGLATLTPDIATVTIQVKTTNEDPAAAQSENSTTMEAVLEALKADGIDEADIATENISLYENYDYDKSPAVVVSYTMNNSVSVTIRDIDNVGQVLSDAIAAGATGTYSLSFSVSDSSGAYQQALKAAVSDAQAKAEAVAEALGVTIKAVPISIDETSASYTPNVYADEANSLTYDTASAAESVSVSTGELEISASVSVTYEIDTGSDQ